MFNLGPLEGVGGCDTHARREQFREEISNEAEAEDMYTFCINRGRELVGHLAFVSKPKA